MIGVYSLKSNSWKFIQSIRYGFPFSQASGVLFNGALHWFPEISKLSSLLSMDINEERFVEQQLPVTLQTTQHCMNGNGNVGRVPLCSCWKQRDF